MNNRIDVSHWGLALTLAIGVHAGLVTLAPSLRPAALPVSPPPRVLVEIAPKPVQPPLAGGGGPTVKAPEPSVVKPALKPASPPVAKVERKPVPNPVKTVSAPVPPPIATVAPVVAPLPVPVVSHDAPSPAAASVTPEAASSGGGGGHGVGHGLGTGPGSEAGVVKVSAAMLANKGNAAYVGTLFSWLEKYRQYPRRARLTNTEGTVMLRFRIDRDGNLLAWSIVRSSGSPLLDKAVEDMISAANPLPKIPVEFGGAAEARSWEFVLPIDFRLLP